jgi:hypothetical protein
MAVYDVSDPAGWPAGVWRVLLEDRITTWCLWPPDPGNEPDEYCECFPAKIVDLRPRGLPLDFAWPDEDSRPPLLGEVVGLYDMVSAATPAARAVEMCRQVPWLLDRWSHPELSDHPEHRVRLLHAAFELLQGLAEDDDLPVDLADPHVLGALGIFGLHPRT